MNFKKIKRIKKFDINKTIFLRFFLILRFIDTFLDFSKSNLKIRTRFDFCLLALLKQATFSKKKTKFNPKAFKKKMLNSKNPKFEFRLKPFFHFGMFMERNNRIYFPHLLKNALFPPNIDFMDFLTRILSPCDISQTNSIVFTFLQSSQNFLLLHLFSK